MLAAAAFPLVTAGCAPLPGFGYPALPAAVPESYTATASAPFRPVTVPGAQRRQAQTEAEEACKRQILEYIGAFPAPGGGTVHDAMAIDGYLRARVLEFVRTAETTDWRVDPAGANVTVCVTANLRKLRVILERR